MQGVAPSPEPEAVLVASSTTTTVVTADKTFTTTSVVTVPQTMPEASGKVRAVAPLSRSKSSSVDVAPAADVNGAAPETPIINPRSPFVTAFDPAKDRSDESLRDFLVSGGCGDCATWEPDGFTQLRIELEKGEATLGLDAEGRVKRVVSVAKPVRQHLKVSSLACFRALRTHWRRCARR